MPDDVEAIIDTNDNIENCNDTAQGGSGTILSVNITWIWYNVATIVNDFWDLNYGIGTDCNTGAPASWTTKETVIDAPNCSDVAKCNSTFNVTADRAWTWSDITNLWIQIDGTQAMSPDSGDLFWDAGFVTVLRDVVTASIESTLWEPSQGGSVCIEGDINIGRWGNGTVEPDATNQNSSNFLRVELQTGSSGAQFTVDWTQSVWTSVSTSDTITIDNNIRFFYFETTGSETGCDFGGSWIDSGLDADGAFTFTYGNDSTSFIWIRPRIEDVGSPKSVANDYNADYTVTLL